MDEEKKNYIISVDLGQVNDFTAITIIEVIDRENANKTYSLRHIERYREVSYPDTVKRVKQLVESGELSKYRKRTHIVIDGTGVGIAVNDIMRRENLKPINLIIIAGHEVTRKGFKYNVPKKELVTNLLVLLQNGKLKIASSLPYCDILVGEFENFKVKVNLKTAHESYEAWRQCEHDDLVLSLAIGCWVGEKLLITRPKVKVCIA